MIAKGMNINNGQMTLEVIHFKETNNHNITLLYCLNDGLYITIKDLTHERGSYYYWHWGHYFSSKQEALSDYLERVKDL